MKRKKEPLLANLKQHTFKHTLIYLLIALSALLLIKIDIDWQSQKEIKEDITLKFERDMGAFELLVTTQDDVLNAKAWSLIESTFATYTDFSGVEFNATPFSAGSGAGIYVYDRAAKQLTAMFNTVENQPILPVFDFFDRQTEGFGLQKKGISVGILDDPQLKTLAYGYLIMTQDQRYYVMVTQGLEDTLKAIYGSVYLEKKPPYVLQTDSKPFVEALQDEQDAILMLLEEEVPEYLTYDFVSETGYSFRQYAKEILAADIPFERPAFFIDIMALIIFAFIGAGLWNYHNLKRTYHQLVRVSHLFDQEPTILDDSVLESYDVEEIRNFLSIVKDILQNIESLLLEGQKQQERLVSKNHLIQSKRLTLVESHQRALASIEVLTDRLATQKTKTYQSLKALMYAIEIRDSYTRGHSDRVEFYAEIIAAQMNISMIQLENVKYGALLHDVGKIGIRETLLNKSINVTLEDTEEFKLHPQIGSMIVEDVDFMEEVTCIILQHHERMDGTGYPLGLMGEDIHPLARIVAVADAYDAMTSNRPYRRDPLTRLEAIEELQNHSGTQFDKDVVRVFIDYLINEEQKG